VKTVLAALAVTAAVAATAATAPARATRTPAAAASARRPLTLPAWSPDGTQIAWVEQGRGIWTAAPDGSAAHRIARTGDDVFQLAWLPTGGLLYDANFRLYGLGLDGTSRVIARNAYAFSVDRAAARVAYQAYGDCPLCHPPLLVQPLAGGPARTIASTAANSGASLSPSGRFVAWLRTRFDRGAGEYGLEDGIWVAPTTGGRAWQATRTGACPHWSPDGRTLLYADGPSLRLVGPAGGRGRLLYRGSGPYELCAAAWSPDGTSVAFARGSDGHLVVVRVATGSTRVVAPLAVASTDAHSPGFAWSPDSRRLLVTGGRTYSACSSLWVVDADGAGLHRLRACS
jgi:Tol biopolymer transport system component